MRLICLPDLTDNFATESGFFGLTVGHQTFAGTDNLHATAGEGRAQER
jgi:hypothetical protein